MDNTVWGGVVGDVGYDGIQIDPNNAVGEAYRYFQEYVLTLKQRGVILAVCSKNDEEIATKYLQIENLKSEEEKSFIFTFSANVCKACPCFYQHQSCKKVCGCRSCVSIARSVFLRKACSIHAA